MSERLSQPRPTRVRIRALAAVVLTLAVAPALSVEAAHAAGGPATAHAAAGGRATGEPGRSRTPSPIREARAHAELLADHPWLPQVNRHFSADRAFRTNCLNCAWATYLNLTGQRTKALPMPRPRDPRIQRLKYFDHVKRHLERQTGQSFQPVADARALDARVRDAGPDMVAIVIGYNHDPGESRHAFNADLRGGRPRYFESQQVDAAVVDSADYDDFEVLLLPRQPATPPSPHIPERPGPPLPGHAP